MVYLSFARAKGLKHRLPSPILIEILELAGYLAVTQTKRVQMRNRGISYLNVVDTRLSFPIGSIFRPTRVEFVVESRDQGWSSYPDQQGTRTSHSFGVAAIDIASNGRARVAAACQGGVLPISLDDRFHVYRNIHAGNDYETQSKVFDASSPLVQNMQALVAAPLHNADAAAAAAASSSDSSSSSTMTSSGEEAASQIVRLKGEVCLIAQSQYPGWENWIRSSSITIKWRLVDFEELEKWENVRACE